MSPCTTQYDKGKPSVLGRWWWPAGAAQSGQPGLWMFSENYCFILKLPLLYIVPSLMHF